MADSAQQRTRPVGYLYMASTLLAFLGAVIALVTQLVEHFQRPRAAANERTRLDTALFGLTILRSAPGIIRTGRKLSHDVRDARAK